MERYDFSGWATRNDIRCADGRTIRRNAFKQNDGKKVPLVWMHQHNDVSNVLGHAYLENREDGVYAFGVFNDTEQGQSAKMLVQHGDISSLSIWANHLTQDAERNVLHGDIKELSLVLAGANTGAVIEDVIEHSDDEDDDAVRFCANMPLTLYHSDDEDDDDSTGDDTDETDETVEHADTSSKEEKPVEDKKKSPEKEEGGKTVSVEDVLKTMNEEQLGVTEYLVKEALKHDDASNEDAGTDDEEGGNDEMKHNLFDAEHTAEENVISHDDMVAIFSDVKRYGTLKESALQHGVENLEILFPEAKATSAQPEFIKREMGWVDVVMNGVHKSPFSRIKSLFADITEDEARAKGYIKGKYKKDEVFSLLKRTTQPTTIYKKQKLDRDDIIDITDFDVVAWIKQEMRMMLNEEIARAILVGDGRLSSDDDHIDENCIRPIWKEEDLFVIRTTLDTNLDANDIDAVPKNFIRKNIKARKDYKGSGNPTLFTTEDMLTDMLLITDSTGRDIYESVEKLKNKLRVKDIVTVPVMEGLTRTDNNKTKELLGIVINLSDYTYGADKGGAVSLFDDFDIDYNAQKYLIETRGSGAITKPYSAIVIEKEVAAG